MWESTYYTGSNNSWCRTPDDNDIWNNAQTFGCLEPGSGTAGYDVTYNSIKGMTSYQYANGDGVLVYPGNDTYDTANSYGLNGPIASWRLKMFRRGVQDADYLAMAYAENPSSTTAILNEIVGGRVMWEYGCFTEADCSYGYGERGFSQDANDYETQRLALADLIPADDGGTTPGVYPTIFGGGRLFR